jgi:hypothetical protein
LISAIPIDKNTEMDTNEEEGIEWPPPFITNSSALPFDLAGATNTFKHQNDARPETYIMVNGPQAGSYFAGLAIVPAILIVILIIWFVLVVILGSRSRDRQLWKTRICTPTALWVILVFLIFGSLIAWVCAFAFAVSFVPQDTKITENLHEASTTLSYINGRLTNVSTNISALNQATAQISLTCSTNNSLINMAIERLSESVFMVSQRATAVTGDLVLLTSDLAEDFDHYADQISYYLNVRTIVVSVLAGIQMTLVLVALIMIVLRVSLNDGDSRVGIKMYRGDSSRKCCCSVRHGRPKCYCGPGFWFSLISVVLMMVLAACMHYLTLLVTDVCAPNVNTNLNRVVSQILDYPPLVLYKGTNVSQMCEIVATNKTYQVPELLNFLCYYQTCEPTSSYLRTTINEARRLANSLNERQQQMKAFLGTIGLGFPSDSPCRTHLRAFRLNILLATVNSFWALEYMSCANINRIYAAIFYEALCDSEVYLSVSMFNSWLAGTVILMFTILYWLLFRQQISSVTRDTNQILPLFGRSIVVSESPGFSSKNEPSQKAADSDKGELLPQAEFVSTANTVVPGEISNFEQTEPSSFQGSVETQQIASV